MRQFDRAQLVSFDRLRESLTHTVIYDSQVARTFKLAVSEAPVPGSGFPMLHDEGDLLLHRGTGIDHQGKGAGSGGIFSRPQRPERSEKVGGGEDFNAIEVESHDAAGLHLGQQPRKMELPLGSARQDAILEESTEPDDLHISH